MLNIVMSERENDSTGDKSSLRSEITDSECDDASSVSWENSISNDSDDNEELTSELQDTIRMEYYVQFDVKNSLD